MKPPEHREPTGRERQQVLDRFLRQGRLVTMPAKEKNRRIVMEQLAGRFEPGRCYTEQQVNRLLRPVFDDHVRLRRELVDRGLLQRVPDGSSYQRPG